MEWIKPSERLPEKGQRVLTCSPQGVMKIVIYRGLDWFILAPEPERLKTKWGRQCYEYPVAYWAELPEPPEL